MLVILDGWGWREEEADNAVRLARTPTFDALWAAGPRAFLRTSGNDVGLPEGQMGNSEVGHLNIGAGRVVMQDLPRIDAAVADGSLAASPVLAELAAKLRASGGTCHLLGLASPGGVHSHQRHAAALARALAAAGVPVAIHAFTDGRDTAPRAAPEQLRALVDDIAGLPGVRFGTVIGRYYAMDRDNRWDRVSRAYAAMVDAEGERAGDAVSAVLAAHARDVNDEFVPATVIDGYAGMRDGDGLLCFNFRADRAREILSALLQPDFAGFPARGCRASRRRPAWWSTRPR
jgi:2,3-bisphosphoglycerate-independent phosphoglycerate mutase